MLKLTVEMVGGEKWPRRFFQLNELIGDWRTFWLGRFLPWYSERVQQNFQTEGELGPRSGWPDLNPRYAAWKARHFPGRLILERTRRLRNSLAVGAEGQDTVIKVGPRELTYGTKVPYAGLQYPERPFLPPVSQKDAGVLLRDWLKEQEQKAGLKSQ